MDREVFQTNIFIAIAVVVIVWFGFAYAFVASNLPIWVLFVVLGIGLVIIISVFKTRLVIEGGMLRYEKVIGGEEVDLKKVALIVSREIETFVDEEGRPLQQTGSGVSFEKKGFHITFGGDDSQTGERKVERVIYIMDEAGRTYFSIPASTIRFKDRTRFKEAIHKVNPNIEVF